MFRQIVRTEPIDSFCLIRDEFDALVHRYRRLVRYRLRGRCSGLGVDVDQLENDVYVSLYQFLQRNNLREWRIEELDRICMTITKRKRLNAHRHCTTKKRSAVQEQLGVSGACECRRSDRWETSEGDDVELEDLLRVAVERSSSCLRLIELWMVGASYSEIAMKLNMTRYAVSRDLGSILEQIRLLLECE